MEKEEYLKALHLGPKEAISLREKENEFRELMQNWYTDSKGCWQVWRGNYKYSPQELVYYFCVGDSEGKTVSCPHNPDCINPKHLKVTE